MQIRTTGKLQKIFDHTLRLALLGIHGTPPIVSSLCFRVNLTANQHGGYECMRCRHQLIIQISASVSESIAVTVRSKGKIRSSIYGKLCLCFINS